MNNQDGFDSRYDVILTGTDLVSSLISAALARVGHKVLHLDCDKHYGKEWRMMKLSDLVLWPLKRSKKPEKNPQLATEERVLQCERPELFSNIEADFRVFLNLNLYQKFFQHLLKTKCTQKFLDRFHEVFTKLQNQVQTYEEGFELMEKFKDDHPEFNRIDNMFVFDLCPRLLFSNEDMVKVLIDSTVTRYIEFKKISRLLTPITQENSNDERVKEPTTEIVEVPCTRSDIFMSNIISPIEKRYLMSFLEKCYRLERNKQWYEEYLQRPFEEFLKSQTLTEKLRKFITNTLLMTSESVTTLAALNRINQFLQAFGRFCDRPFLFPLYGSEDVIQAFCRYGAVWGGLYCLGADFHGAVLDEKSKKCLAAMANRSRIECDYLVTDYHFPELKPKISKKRMSRAIILNTKSIKAIDPENDLGDLSFLHLPPDFTDGSSVYCFESDHSSRVCPKDFYLQYFWCDSRKETAKLDLEPVIEKLLSLDQESQPSDLPHELRKKILLTVYFNYDSIETKYEMENFPSNIKLVTPPVNELNYETAVNEAQRLFSEMYPEDIFFPITTEPNTSPTMAEGDHVSGNDPLDDIEI